MSDSVRVGLQRFSIKHLNEIGRPSAKVDGLWVQMIDAEIRRVIEDLHSRPALPDKRRVKMSLVFEPVTDERGCLEDVEVYLDCDASIPKQQSRPFAFKPSQNEDAILFSPAHADRAALFEGTKADATFSGGGREVSIDVNELVDRDDEPGEGAFEDE